jgi:hypothetical protein
MNEEMIIIMIPIMYVIISIMGYISYNVLYKDFIRSDKVRRMIFVSIFIPIINIVIVSLGVLIEILILFIYMILTLYNDIIWIINKRT